LQKTKYRCEVTRSRSDYRPIDQNRAMNSPLNEFFETLRFNSEGLIVAIAQDESTKKVLMQAWMNKQAIEKTIQSGKVTYYSRSRKALWTKGETSGNTQELVRISSDCDGDSLLVLVRQTGPACHTNSESCFDAAISLERLS